MLTATISHARAEAQSLLRRGIAALAGMLLMMAALGLALSAAIIETAAHLGLVGSLGLWGAITFLLAVGVLKMARAPRSRPRVPLEVPAATDMPSGVPPIPAGMDSDAYRLGERIGRSVPPLGLVAAVALLGVVCGRRRR